MILILNVLLFIHLLSIFFILSFQTFCLLSIFLLKSNTNESVKMIHLKIKDAIDITNAKDF